jgi:hypothetical protein
MRIQFWSSHVNVESRRDGELTVDVGIEHAGAPITIHDQLTFSVPTDYHAHNDLVAAALLTLISMALYLRAAWPHLSAPT